jgi:hypothetical protein
MQCALNTVVEMSEFPANFFSTNFLRGFIERTVVTAEVLSS